MYEATHCNVLNSRSLLGIRLVIQKRFDLHIEALATECSVMLKKKQTTHCLACVI